MVEEKTDIKFWKLKNSWMSGNRPENLGTKIGSVKIREAWQFKAQNLQKPCKMATLDNWKCE